MATTLDMTRHALCVFGSEGDEDDRCPIEINTPEAGEHCPCRRRDAVLDQTFDVCTWPERKLASGSAIVNSPAFAEQTRRRCWQKAEHQRIMGKQMKQAESPPVAVAEAEVIAERPASGSEVVPFGTPAPSTAVEEAKPAAVVPQATPKRPAPKNLAGALALAQAKCNAARKDGRNSHHGYRYASAESIITEAKAALAETGLALVPIELSWGPSQKGTGHEIVRKFLLIHESGESIPLACEWPIVEERGRPLDKATAISSTASLAYLLRDLLLMPRVSSADDLAAQNDKTPPVSARAIAEQRAREAAEKEAAAKAETESRPAEAPAPREAITDTQLATIASLRSDLLTAKGFSSAEATDWWGGVLREFGVSSAKALTKVRAVELVQRLRHELASAQVMADAQAQLAAGGEHAPQ